MARGGSGAERAWHRKQAASLFNQVWRLLEKRRRTRSEDDEMIHAAHASRYHWGRVGKPVQWSIGEWQVSRVYAVLRRPEPALYHARRCLALCREHKIRGFPRAFAYEALARASAVAGRSADRGRFLRLGAAEGRRIPEKEDRELVFSDLATVPAVRRNPSRGRQARRGVAR